MSLPDSKASNLQPEFNMAAYLCQRISVPLTTNVYVGQVSIPAVVYVGQVSLPAD